MLLQSKSDLKSWLVKAENQQNQRKSRGIMAKRESGKKHIEKDEKDKSDDKIKIKSGKTKK